MRKTITEKGITLVALIITIIILLILAVVTIGSIKNSNIITYAQNASTDYNRGKDKEGSLIDGYESLIESKIPGENNGSVIGKATVGKIADKNSTIDGNEYSSNNPIVPAGFAPINITTTGQEASWNAEGGPEVNKGLVIRDDIGNEFVWIPITTEINIKGYGLETQDFREPDVIVATGNIHDAISDNLLRAGCRENQEDNDTILTVEDFKVELAKMYEEMAESVNRYEGFYVGRYEVSFDEERKAQSKGSTETKPVYSAINSTTSSNKNNATDWYGLYALCKTYNTSSVKSSMIWGIQYNSMMNWMGETADSYKGNDRNTDTQRRTGYVSTDVINNVYDLYGNSFEWTLEAVNIGGRVNRGGSYLDDYTPSKRYSSSASGTPQTNNGINGSRLVIYVI